VKGRAETHSRRVSQFFQVFIFLRDASGSVEDFFDSVQLGPPEIAHVVKPRIDRFEPLVDAVESRFQPKDHHPDERAVKCHRRGDRNDLLTRHLFCSAAAYGQVAADGSVRGFSR